LQYPLQRDEKEEGGEPLEPKSLFAKSLIQAKKYSADKNYQDEQSSKTRDLFSYLCCYKIWKEIYWE